MSLKHSLASKKRWSKILPEVRSRIMSDLAKKRQSMMTVKEKSIHGRLMVEMKLKHKKDEQETK